MLERVLEPEAMDTADEAREYDTMDHSGPNEAFVERLLQLGARGRMLDIGTGPGHIPVMLCRRVPECTILGIDLSGHMLEVARRNRTAAAFDGRIDFRLVDAKRLPFADGAFDTVFSNTILHHIADPRPFLAEAWRVLRPGGAFLIRDLFRPADEATLERLVREHAGDATPHQQQMFRASLRAALTPDELRALISELGRPGVEVVIDTDRHMSVQRPAD